MSSRSRRRFVVPEEQVEDVIAQLLAISDAAAEKARKLPGHVTSSSPRKPDVTDELIAGIKDALEDEVTPAVVTESGSISKREIDHEVVKKALIGLKLFKLRTLARDRDIAVSGGAEDVATRIARAYHWDEQEIARLILDNEDEPRPEHEFSDRLYPIVDHPGLAYIRDRLEVVAGRYIRVGVARWFVFTQIKFDPELIVIEGSYRSYSARVDDTSGEPSLGSVAFEQNTRIQLNRHPMVRVRAESATAAKGAMAAVQLAANLTPRGYVAPSVEKASLRPVSVFMLDLLFTRFRNLGLDNPNLTVARFSMDESARGGEEDSSKPALRAVRFEGTHLLDSVPACRLLARENRALTDVSLVVETASPRGRFPLRISVESDNVRISTGFGTDAEQATSVHSSVVAAVSRELEDGVVDAVRLRWLVDRIQKRATAADTPEQANILLEQPDDDDYSDDAAVAAPEAEPDFEGDWSAD